MGVFKATDRQKKEDSGGTFRATQYRTYDYTLISEWETQVDKSSKALNDYYTKINNGQYLSSNDLKNYNSALDTYIKAASNLRALSQNKHDDNEWNNTINEMRSHYGSASDYYSQWDTEDAFNKYIADSAAQEQAWKEILGGYDATKNFQEGLEGWNEYSSALEAAQKAAAEASDDRSFWDKVSDFILQANNMSNKMYDTPAAHGFAMAIEGNKTAEQAQYYPRADWTDEQRAAYGYLWKQNQAKAAQYAYAMNNSLDYENEKKTIDKISEWSTQNPITGAIATAGSVAASPLALVDYLNDLAYFSANGYVPETDGIVTPFEFSQAAEGAISAKLNEKYGTLDNNIPVFGGKGLGDVYGLKTSIAKSVASAYTLGSAGTLISYFGQGAASGIDDALSRGATPGQALLYGTALGVFEGVAESIGIDNLFKLGSSSTIKGFIANILRQAGAEGAEEGLTTILGNIADIFVMQDKSNFAKALDQYKSTGMSESEAKWQVFWDSIEGIAYDTISGAASGGISGGIHTTVQTVSANKEASKLYGNNTGALITKSLEIDPNNKFAQKMQSRFDGGKKLSGGQINRLLDANESTMRSTDTQKIQNAIKDRLTRLGETGNIEKIAKALTKQAAGKSLTVFEQRTIDNSKYGQRVANELDPENIRSGQYASAWAEAIGTDTVNAPEYNSISKSPAPPTAQNSQTSAKINETGVESEFDSVTLESASKKYGTQAEAMVRTYKYGQNVVEYDSAYNIAYEMGKAGVSLDYAMESKALSYLTEDQRELAWISGQMTADTKAQRLDKKNKSLAKSGKTVRKIGAVKGEGVTIADLKKSFNDTQNKAFKVLSFYAQATGIDIVLYKSEIGADGKFKGSQGRFQWSDDKIYIDINSGLVNIDGAKDLSKYTMLRTFSHEFTHFIEKWNPICYNEFRKVVFDTLTERGENVDELIREKQAMSDNMTYDKASREVVAEAMTDILPDTSFAEKLATKHKNIFEKLLAKLKEFLSDLREYWSSIADNRSREANALKDEVGDSMRYVESIVKLFDKVALEAVENYQMTVGSNGTDIVQEQSRNYNTERGNINGREEHTYGNLDNSRNGRRSAAQYAKKELLQGSGSFSLADRNINETWKNEGRGRKTLLRTDSEGIRIGEDNLKKLSGTSIVDANGHPLAVYHSTNADFSEFNKGDIGFHFGNKVQAQKRADDKGYKNPKFIRAYLNIKNPATSTRDTMSWRSNATAMNLWSVNIITDAEYSEIEKLYQPSNDEYNSPAAVRLREILESKGYDGIAYPNGFEGDGISYIAFRNDQIVITKDDSNIVQEQSREYLDKDYMETVENYQMTVSGERVDISETETVDEKGALLAYKSGGSYSLNAKIRESAELNEYEQSIVDNLDKVLEKLPTYQGKVYRNIQFDGFGDAEARDAFVAGHIIDGIVKYISYTSTSTRVDGYPLDGKYVVHLEIDSKSGRNTEGHGSDSESEVLFPRGINFVVNDIIYDENGTPTIYLTEAKNENERVHKGRNDGHTRRDKTGESGSRTYDAVREQMQQVPEQTTSDYKVQSVPERNPGQNLGRKAGVQGVQAEITDIFYGENPNIQYQQRTGTLSDREILEMAADEIKVEDLTPGEAEALRIFKKRLDTLREYQEERAELGKLYKEQQFGENPNRDEATKTLNRMHVYDGKVQRAINDVLSIEDKEVFKSILKKAKKVVEAQERARSAERVQKYRERAAQKLEDQKLAYEMYYGRKLAEARVRSERELSETKKRYQEARNKNVEGRHKTEVRNKVKKVVGELNSLLLNPTKEKHIPIGLQKPVAEALEVINMDTVDADTRLAEIHKQIQKETDREKLDILYERYGRIKSQGDKLDARLAALKAAYSDIKNSSDQAIQDAYDEVIENRIEYVAGKVENTPIRNMSLEQLTLVHDLFKMLLTNIRGANKVFTAQKRQTISELAESSMKEFTEASKQLPDFLERKDVQSSGKLDVRNFFINDLETIDFFEVIGSDTLNGLYEALREGELTYYRDIDKAARYSKEQQKRYHYSNWDLKSRKSFTSADGVEFKLNVGQMMIFRALAKQKDGLLHLFGGGFKFKKNTEIWEKIKGVLTKKQLNDPQIYKINNDVLEKINNALTDEQRAFADEMQKYLSVELSKDGNEVSVKLYGIELFHTDGDYFRINVSEESVDSPTGASQGNPRIKNMGMAKARTKKSTNPVIIGDFMDVWIKSVKDMALYHGLALPTEDLSRVLNYRPSAVKTIVVDADPELTARIDDVKEKESKYRVISNYLKEKFNGEIFTLSNGETAIMDNRDADKLASYADNARTVQLGNLRQIVESADYSHSEEKVEHRKFSTFHYYAIDVIYGYDTYKLWINVGVAKNDGQNHIYAITKRTEGASTVSGDSRPVGNAIVNAPSNDNIAQQNKFVKNLGEKSFKQALDESYGTVAEKYIRDLLVSINGGVNIADALGVSDRLFSTFKKVSVQASLSSAIQQPSALPRAMVELHPKYFVGIPTVISVGRIWEEIRRYAPVAIQKDIGGFDTGTGKTTARYIQSREYKGILAKGAAIFKDENFRDDAFSAMASFADRLTWVQIWNAVLREQLDIYNISHPEHRIDMSEFKRSEELMQKAAKRFDYVITKTQVYDSVLKRSAIMRSNNFGTKMATVFMAEDNKTVSMLEVAAVRHARGQKGLGRAIKYIIISKITNSMLVAIAYAIRDDDDEKTFLERYLSSLVNSLISASNPLNAFPYARDVVSLIEGYDIERADMSMIANVINATRSLSSTMEKLFEGEEITGFDIADAVINMLGHLGSLKGYPTKNIVREIRAIMSTIKTELKEIPTTGAGIGYAIGDTIIDTVPFLDKAVDKDSNSDKLYRAILSGDEKQTNRIKSLYKNESEIDSAIKKGLRENDKRIKQAAASLMAKEFDSYYVILDEISDEGKFSRQTASEAIKAEKNYLSGKISDAAKAKSEGDNDEYKKIVRVLRERYRGIFTQDEIIALIAKIDS